MKKIIIMALSVLFVASITACGSTETTAPVTPAQEAPSTAPEATTEQVIADPNTAKFDNFILVYKGATIIKNDNDSILQLTFDYTNLKDDSQAFIFASSVKAFQNGVELSDAYFLDANLEAGQKELKKDVTFEVYEYYKIDDLATPIEVEIAPLITFNADEKVTITIDPSTLQS